MKRAKHVDRHQLVRDAHACLVAGEDATVYFSPQIVAQAQRAMETKPEDAVAYLNALKGGDFKEVKRLGAFVHPNVVDENGWGHGITF